MPCGGPSRLRKLSGTRRRSRAEVLGGGGSIAERMSF